MIKALIHKHWRKWLASIIAVLAIGFFIQYSVENFAEIPSVKWSWDSIAVFTFSVGLIVFSIGIVAIIWHRLLHDHGYSYSWQQTQTIFAIAQFGKYLPGNVGQHVGRVVMAREIGIPVKVSLNTMAVEMLWGTSIAFGLALISSILFVDIQSLGPRWEFGPLQLTLGVLLLFIMPWLCIGFINKCLPGLAKRLSGGGSIVTPNISTAFISASLFLICFLVIGVILKLQAQWFFGVTEGTVFELTCLFSVAWLAGYLMPGAPGGLGVRESMMLVLLSPVIGVGASIGLGITMRLTTTIGDFVAFSLGIYARRWIHKKSFIKPL